MLDLPRLQFRLNLKPVQASRQRPELCGFLNHHGLHGREGTSRRAGASTSKHGSV